MHQKPKRDRKPHLFPRSFFTVPVALGMIIHHDTSYAKPSSAKWITKGYAMEDICSLRLQFLYTEAQQEENRMAHAAGIRDIVQLRQAAEHRNAVMAPIMGAIAHNFICYGYTEDEPAPYLSDRWEFYFWCNDFTNIMYSCGLSGRDYSYFTLTFNERQTVSHRRDLCERLLQFLNTYFKDHPNLHVTVQYSTWYDSKKIEVDAKKIQHLLAGHRHTYGGKEGRFFLENGQLLFRPKYAKRSFHRVDYADILAICWELGLTLDAVDEADQSVSLEPESPKSFLPYEKYGSIHQIQLTVTSYIDGNLAIQMVIWEDGHPEPWASLTVNLDGKRQKDCAFIDTNGDPDFPIWIIRNGLAIPTGVIQCSGFCEYPEYRFRADRLQELDPDGYASYLASQKSGKSA